MKLPRLLLMFFAALAFAGASDARDHRHDRDDNPPGPRGGPGTNWENPPGWKGGPGASPDHRYYRRGKDRIRFDVRDDGYYFNSRYGYYHPRYGFWDQRRRCWRDRDDNPPGPRGGPGASPDRFGGC